MHQIQILSGKTSSALILRLLAESDFELYGPGDLHRVSYRSLPRRVRWWSATEDCAGREPAATVGNVPEGAQRDSADLAKDGSFSFFIRALEFRNRVARITSRLYSWPRRAK